MNRPERIMLQFPGATGRVKLVDELEVNEQHVTALLVVLSHSVAIVDAESNELLKTYDFQTINDHNTINDAVYVLSIRSIIVAFRDGTMALIPPNCVDPKLLPRSSIKEPLVSLCVVGEDVVIGWTASGAVCEVPVFAGRMPEEVAGTKKMSKEALKAAAECARLGCVLKNTGVVTAINSTDSVNGSISYSFVQYSHTNSESLLASRPSIKWMDSSAREISAAAIPGASSNGNWRTISICPDPTSFGAVLFLVSQSSSAEKPKSKKKSKDSSVSTETGYYLLKIDVNTNSLLLARKLNSHHDAEAGPVDTHSRKRARSSSATDNAMDAAVYLLVAGGVVWIVWSSGFCEAFNSKHGVPVVLPHISCTDAPNLSGNVKVTCSLPGQCEEQVLNCGSCRDTAEWSMEGGEQGHIVSLIAEPLNSDKNSYLFFALCSSGDTKNASMQLWHRVTSLFEASGQSRTAAGTADKLSFFKPTSLCAAIGSIQSSGPDVVTSTADTSGGVLAGLPRTCKRRLQVAQTMLAEELNRTVDCSASAAVPSTPQVAQTPEPASVAPSAKKSAKKAVPETPDVAAAPEVVSESGYQYIGMGKPKSATKAYLESNIDAVEAFVAQLDNVLAAENGASLLKSSDWSVLQAVLRTEMLSIQKRASLWGFVLSSHRIDVLADIAQYCPDLSEAQAITILMFSITCPENVADRYCLDNGRLKARTKQDTAFVKAATDSSAVLATPQPVEKSAKKSAKKGKKGPESSDSELWQPNSHDIRSIMLSVFSRSLLNRNCAFSVPSLIVAAQSLPQDAASIVLSSFTALLDGHLSNSISNSAVDSQLTDNFNDRQVSMALNWIEALLDSHYSGFAMALSMKQSDEKQAHAVKVTATVLRKLFTMTMNAENTLSELESMFGLWTHVSRSAKCGVLNVGASSAEVTLGGTGGAVYQIETLEL